MSFSAIKSLIHRSTNVSEAKYTHLEESLIIVGTRESNVFRRVCPSVRGGGRVHPVQVLSGQILSGRAVGVGGWITWSGYPPMDWTRPIQGLGLVTWAAPPPPPARSGLAWSLSVDVNLRNLDRVGGLGHFRPRSGGIATKTKGW